MDIQNYTFNYSTLPFLKEPIVENTTVMEEKVSKAALHIKNIEKINEDLEALLFLISFKGNAVRITEKKGKVLDFTG